MSVACETEIVFLFMSTARILQVFVKKVFYDESNIKQSEKVEVTAEVFLAMQDYTITIQSKRKGVFPVTQNLTAVQSTLSHTTFLLVQYGGDMEIYKRARHLSCTRWSKKWLSYF